MLLSVAFGLCVACVSAGCCGLSCFSRFRRKFKTLISLFIIIVIGRIYATAGVNLKVVVPKNQPPDCTAALPSITTCWPPNHKFQLVEIQGVTDPDDDPVTITIDSITQDEVVNDSGLGSGNTCPDAAVVDVGGGNQAAGVRCERNGTGNGRVYTINFTASDDQGAECMGSVNFCVPHNKKSMCVDDGQLYDSTCSEGAGAGSPVLSLEEFHLLTPAPLFMRGDVNWDEEIDISDGIAILHSLFQTGEPLDCPDAADANDDGDVDISDAVAVFSYLFLGGSAPAEPTLLIGLDPTVDELSCGG